VPGDVELCVEADRDGVPGVQEEDCTTVTVTAVDDDLTLDGDTDFRATAEGPFWTSAPDGRFNTSDETWFAKYNATDGGIDVPDGKEREVLFGIAQSEDATDSEIDVIHSFSTDADSVDVTDSFLVDIGPDDYFYIGGSYIDIDWAAKSQEDGYITQQ